MKLNLNFSKTLYQIAFLTHTVQMKQAERELKAMSSQQLLNPHGSDETLDDLLTSVIKEHLLNPHGSDETILFYYHILSAKCFLTHTVQMKQFFCSPI